MTWSKPSWARGDTIVASVLTNQTSEANVAPIIVLHDNGLSGPADAA